jgi:hypothetical protein
MPLQSASRLFLVTSLVAALSACYVVPIDPRTGQPVPLQPPAQVTVVQPPAAAVPVPPQPTLLQARLYPMNDVAQSAGFVTASIMDQQVGRGSISLNYRGHWLQGEATRVDANHPGFGRIHSQVLGGPVPGGNGRRGIANAVGGGLSAQCEYQLSAPGQGVGACLFSDGASYQMHFSR